MRFCTTSSVVYVHVKFKASISSCSKVKAKIKYWKTQVRSNMPQSFTFGLQQLCYCAVLKYSNCFVGHEDDTTSTQLTILSFPQYCRYRAVLKRVESMENKWLRNAIICAIGGITSYTKNNRIMYCRDLVDFPDLEDLEFRCDHLGRVIKLVLTI